MGKVKTRVLLQLTMELNKYQFPMGKVKLTREEAEQALKEREKYQSPMGKVKLLVQVFWEECSRINPLWER